MTDKIDDLDSFDFNPSVVDDSSVAPIEEDPLMTPVEPIQEIPHILKQYLTDEEQQQVRNLYSSNEYELNKIASKYIACIDSDEEEKVDIKKCQEDFIKNIRAFLKKQNKKGGRKKRRKTRRKSKKRKRKTKRRRKKRKTKRGGAHRWGNYADFYNYLKKIDREKNDENASIGKQYTFRYKDSGLEKTETLAIREEHEDGGTYYFIFFGMINNDPEFIMEHTFDSSVLDGEEPYEEVQFKIPILPRAPEPGGGGRKKRRRKKRKTKRGGAHIWGNYADFYNYLKEIDEKHQAETGEEEGSLGAPYTFRYIDSGLEETEALAHKEADEDGTYIFTFWITSEDPELLMTHNFDSGDILDGEEPYEEVQFKIPIFPEPEGGGRKKKRKTKKRRR